MVAGKKMWGKAPARLQRLFQWDDDDEYDGERRLMVEGNWCWDHDNIIKVPGYECIPENILELMESDPRYVVEGDLSFCDEFETIVSDASVFRIEDAERIHPADSDAFILVGAVEFDVSERDATAVERVRSFTQWPSNRSLEQATPSKPKANVKRPSGVQPRAWRTTTAATCARSSVR